MQKRYFGDRDPSEPADVLRVPATEPVGKSFHLGRRWDYRRVDRPPGDPLLSEVQLNALGSDGWELAGVVQDADGVHYIFKKDRK